MKILFLDHDGVICLSNNWGGRYKKYKEYLKKHPGTPMSDCPTNIRFDNFDTKSIKVLNDIITSTNCEIVVSSDWRHHATLSEIGDYYIEQGVCKRPLSFTPKTKDIDPVWWKTFVNQALLEHERVVEIKYWLSCHPEVTHWVAVDDLNLGVYDHITGDLFNENGLTNFVHTTLENEGIKQSGIKDRILFYLN